MLHKMVLTFKFVDEISKCDHPNESSCTALSYMVQLFIMLYKVVLTFESVDKILECNPSKMLFSNTLLVWCCPVCFKTCYKKFGLLWVKS